MRNGDEAKLSKLVWQNASRTSERDHVTGQIILWIYWNILTL